MAVNAKCPKCGSTKVQLSNESSKHGCLYMVLFGIWYFMWLMCKWCIGMMVFFCYDWWMAIVHKVSGADIILERNKNKLYILRLV